MVRHDGHVEPVPPPRDERGGTDVAEGVHTEQIEAASRRYRRAMIGGSSSIATGHRRPRPMGRRWTTQFGTPSG